MASKAPVRQRLVDHLGSVLLALVLAIIVWVNAIYQTDRPREDVFPEPIPIEHINRPEHLIAVNDPPETVRVRIRTFTSSWPSLTSKSFRAVADWSGVSEGSNEVPVKVSSTDRTVSVLRVQPSVLTAEMEQLEMNVRNVDANLEGIEDLPLGYSVELVGVEPDAVTLKGPASRVGQVERLVAFVSLVNMREPGERNVPVVALDGDGRPIEGVSTSPEAVTVSFDIQRRLNYREVAVRARTVGNPARGYFVSSVNVDPATITVVGPPAIIATMPGLVSVDGEVDVSGATRMVAARLGLDLPSGVSVLAEGEEQPQEILVTVGIDAVMGGTTVEMPLQIRKLSEGMAATLSVPSVDVIITGPSVLLDGLQIDLLDAYVDLGGLGAGTHQVRTAVEILVSQHPELGDLQVSSISPAYVEAVVRESVSPTPGSD